MLLSPGLLNPLAGFAPFRELPCHESPSWARGTWAPPSSLHWHTTATKCASGGPSATGRSSKRSAPGTPIPVLASPVPPTFALYGRRNSRGVPRGGGHRRRDHLGQRARGIESAGAPARHSPRSSSRSPRALTPGPDGHDVQLLPDTITEFITAPVVAVGGPSKANEVARGLPTAVVFGSRRCRGACVRPRDLRHAGVPHRADRRHHRPGGRRGHEECLRHCTRRGRRSRATNRIAAPQSSRGPFPAGHCRDGSAWPAPLGGEPRPCSGWQGPAICRSRSPRAGTASWENVLVDGDSPADAVQALASRRHDRRRLPGRRLRLSLLPAGSRRCLARRGRSLPLLDALWQMLYCDAEPAATLWGAV